MDGIRIVALPTDVAEEVRRTLLAPGYDHPAHLELAAGYGPCRVCLHTFESGVDKRILFTHDPFAGLEPYPLPGPIYIHAEACQPHPQDQGLPRDLVGIPVTLNGYGRGRALHVQERVPGAHAEAAIRRILDRPGVSYVHIRNTEAGCYIARAERRR